MEYLIRRIRRNSIIVITVFGVFLSGCLSEDGLEQARRDASKSALYYQHAVERYKRLIANSEAAEQERFELGKLYYDHGDFRMAVTELEKSIAPGAAKFLALASYHLGDYSRAYDIFRKGDFSDAQSSYFYGLAAEKLNLFDEAVKIYKGIKGGAYGSEAKARIDTIRKDGKRHIKDIEPAASSYFAGTPGVEEYPQAGALILSCDESIEVRPDGTQIARVHYLIKILNDRGKEDYAEAKIGYDSTYEKVELEYARTIKPDGQVVEVGSGNIRDVSMYMNFPLYSNARLYIISFPEVSAGSVIEYKAAIHTSQLINKKDFIMGYPVQAAEPVLSANFSLTLPKDRPFHYKVINEAYNDFSAQLAPQKEELGETVVYKWSFKDLPQLVPESNMPPDTSINPSFLISTFDDWRQVYDWWWSLSKDRMKADTPISQKVAELIEGKVTQEEKLRSIYNFCARDIRYVAVEYGQAGYQPHYAADIFRNKYGDCKDQAVLLVTMLKVAGIQADLVLISTYDYYDLVPDLPSALFNHAIAVARIDGRDIFLDPTASTCSVGDLPPSDQQRGVLVFMEDGYRIERTPLYESRHNAVTQETDINIDPDGAISARRKITPFGFYNQAQRYWLLYTQPELIRETLKERIQEISVGSRLLDYSVSGLQDPDKPVVLSYEFSGPEYFTVAGDLRIAPALASVDTSLAANQKREYPLDLTAPDKRETIFRITIPVNYQIKYMPDNVLQDSPWFEFNADYSRLGNVLVFRQGLVFKVRQISRGEYADFKKIYDGLAQKIKQNIILEVKN